jgi:hypothetical protein
LGDSRGYTCEIYDWSARVLQLSEGVRNEHNGRLGIVDLPRPTRRHLGRIRWTALGREAVTAWTLAGRSDAIDEPTFAQEPSSARQAELRDATSTTRQGQGGAVAAMVQVASEQANGASLNYRVQAELNRLVAEVHRLPLGPGEGVLAVVETETRQYGGMSGGSFLGCHLVGAFANPAEGIRQHTRRPGLSTPPRDMRQLNRGYYWGMLE